MNTGAHTPPHSDQIPADESAGETVIDAVVDGPAAAPASDREEPGAEELEPASHEAAEQPDTAANAESVDEDAEARGPESMELELLAAAEARADDNWDRLLRLQADMENQRKRAQRDVTNARKFALEGIVGDLLPVRDSLEMGLAAAAEEGGTIESLREGAELTLKMLASALEKHNIVPIDPVGEKFNPEFHQAMTMQPVEGAAPNTVVNVMQKGYTLNDRLIRPALVMVAK